MSLPRLAPLLAAAALLAAPVHSRAAETPAHGATTATGAVPLMTDRGSYHMTITTAVPAAQQYFDQGMRLMFGFNLEEAERSFEQAEKLDPTCAMCAWGTAFSLGPHYNLPAMPDRTVKANAAAQRALRLATKAMPIELALIEAMTKRYADPAPTKPEDQAKLDGGYADAMHDVLKRFPDNADVNVLWAEATMDIHPWDLY